MGSAIFGIGWGLTGGCPGPIFVQIGAVYTIAIVILLSAIAGTWCYSLLREKLPR